MISYAARNVRALKRRLLGTAAAITLGVALIAGTYVSTDTISQVVGEASAAPGRPVDVIVVDRRSPLTGEDVDDIAWIPDLLETGHLTPLPAQLTDELEAADSVASATGATIAPVDLIAPDGDVVTGQGAPIARSIDGTFGPFLASGHLPVGSEDVILSHSTASAERLDLGQPVDIVLPNGRIRSLTLVGTVDDAALPGNLLVGLAPATATTLLGASGEHSIIELKAAPGTSDQQILDAITGKLTGHQGAITGTDLRRWSQDEAAQFTGLLRWVISIAGLVALLLGSFTIRNTFAIVLAARARELALLRCIGATRRQIHRLVLVEAGIVGLVASGAGLALGIVLAGLVGLLVDSDDVVAVAVGGATPVVTARTIAAALAVGVGSATVSALGAARRATRISPVAALRQDVQHVARREGRVRSAAGSVLVAASSAGLVVAQVTGAEPGPKLVGVLGLIVGIVAAGPVLAKIFATIIGAPLARLFGVTGDLARANSRRNPRRSSATILPLAIGLALMIAFAGFTASVTGPITSDLESVWTADLRITRTPSQASLPTGNRLSPDVVDRVEEAGAFSAVVPLQTSADYTLAGDQLTSVTGVVAAQLPSVTDVIVVAGSLDEIHSGAIAISNDIAAEQQAQIGDTLQIDAPEGGFDLVVRAIYQQPALSAAGDEYEIVDEVPYGDVLVNPADYQRTTGRTGIDMIFAKAPDGVTPTIALLGIANTLALSITERRREIGLLRAVGLDRRQAQATILLEAGIIAIAATGIALTLGALLGQAFTEAQSLPYQPSATQLALIAVITTGIVVSVAIRPAQRASRLPILTALAAE